MADSDTIGDDVHLSNKSCRRYYTKAQCSCPPGRCWYDEQLERRNRGEAALTSAAWYREQGIEPPKPAEVEADSAKAIREAAEGVLRAVDKGHKPNTTNSMKAAEGALRLLGDLEAAAGELQVEVPPPGTDLAKLLTANKLLRDQRDEALRERDLLWEHARDRVDWFDGESEVADLAEKLP